VGGEVIAFSPLRSFRVGAAAGGDARIADRLHADTVLLRYPDGAAYRWKHVTAFSALSDLLAGRTGQLRDYAAWTRDAGGNGWRVFGGWSRLALDYRKEPRYFDALAELAQLTLEESLRLQFVAICDYIPADTSAARAFVDRCAATLAPFTHVFLSLANEPYKNLTGGDDAAAAWPVPGGVLFDRGAAAIGDPDRFTPLPNGAALSVAHLPRGGEWYRKGKDLYEIRESYPGTKGPVVDDEPTKVSIDGADPARWFWFGVTHAMFGAGGTFHGDADTLQLCRRPPAPEDACARAFFAGMDLVPLEAATWRYGRYGEGNPGTPHVVAEDPSAIRVYEMSSAGQAVAVAVGGTRPLVAVNGWRIASASADGTAAVLER
jgi:hypothetical protein